MKKFLALIIIVTLGIWGYRSCIHKESEEQPEALKQVKVTAMSVNLRTGPGTNYDFATVSEDGSGGKWKLKRGTVLEVVSESGDWYEVRVVGGSRTGYLKKSHCIDLDKANAKANNKAKKEQSSKQKPEKDKGEITPHENSATDVVEEVTKGKPQDDDVIF
jgi:SH3-like domain-containing protein